MIYLKGRKEEKRVGRRKGGRKRERERARKKTSEGEIEKERNFICYPVVKTQNGYNSLRLGLA